MFSPKLLGTRPLINISINTKLNNNYLREIEHKAVGVWKIV